jgi:hypothetical protein
LDTLGSLLWFFSFGVSVPQANLPPLCTLAGTT